MSVRVSASCMQPLSLFARAWLASAAIHTLVPTAYLSNEHVRLCVSACACGRLRVCASVCMFLNAYFCIYAIECKCICDRLRVRLRVHLRVIVVSASTRLFDHNENLHHF